MENKISEHFSWNEGFESSDGAIMPADIRENVIATVVNGLEKIRVKWGKPIRVNCCYRSPEHNAATKGSSKTSAHMLGFAVDIDASSDTLNDELGALIVNMVKSGEIECDQLIFEKLTPPDGFKWIHYGYRKDRNTPPRKQFLICTDAGEYLPVTPELAKKFSIEL